MARNSHFVTSEPEEKDARSRRAKNDDAGLDELLEGRAGDLDLEQEPQFLRAQRRISVRRGPLPKKTANRLKAILPAFIVILLFTAAAFGLYAYVTRSWRFFIASRDHIEVTGLGDAARKRVFDLLSPDIGRNIFRISLADRKRQIEEIPWVEFATVMRLLPDRLRIDVRRRVPVAFVRVGPKISLIDKSGVVMEMAGRSEPRHSFPVITGVNEGEPLSTRVARMKVYLKVINELDSEGANYSRDLSEIDVSDPEDVRITAADPNGAVLVHLGSSDFLQRYKIYIAHLQEWRQQFSRLASVDLRYDQQIIVNPDPMLPAGAATGKAEERTLPQAHSAGNSKKTSAKDGAKLRDKSSPKDLHTASGQHPRKNPHPKTTKPVAYP